MTAGRRTPITILILGTAVLLLSACATTAPTQFYILHPMSDTGIPNSTDTNEKISIALSPVKLPERLNRSQIVTRQEGHRVKVDEFNRWAEPLDAGVTIVLAENLSLLLDTDRISVPSRIKYTEYEYNLVVDIIRFDGQIGGDAALICRWSLYTGDGKSTLTVQRSSITRPVEGDGYQDLVAAMSGMLADLSREIAEGISSYR